MYKLLATFLTNFEVFFQLKIKFKKFKLVLQLSKLVENQWRIYCRNLWKFLEAANASLSTFDVLSKFFLLVNFFVPTILFKVWKHTMLFCFDYSAIKSQEDFRKLTAVRWTDVYFVWFCKQLNTIFVLSCPATRMINYNQRGSDGMATNDIICSGIVFQWYENILYVMSRNENTR